jgi:hypothetical protein
MSRWLIDTSLSSEIENPDSRRTTDAKQELLQLHKRGTENRGFGFFGKSNHAELQKLSVLTKRPGPPLCRVIA